MRKWISAPLLAMFVLPAAAVFQISRANFLLVQVLDGDVWHGFDAGFVDDFDLEVGEVDDEALLDFFDAILDEIVGFVTCHVCK